MLKNHAFAAGMCKYVLKPFVKAPTTPKLLETSCLLVWNKYCIGRIESVGGATSKYVARKDYVLSSGIRIGKVAMMSHQLLFLRSMIEGTLGVQARFDGTTSYSSWKSILQTYSYIDTYITFTNFTECRTGADAREAGRPPPLS